MSSKLNNSFLKKHLSLHEVRKALRRTSDPLGWIPITDDLSETKLQLQRELPRFPLRFR